MPGHSTNQSGTRALRVAIIGSGFGGIATAVKLQEAGFTDFTVFEKNPGPGGTWWENSYPGAQVDVISAYYSYSFMYDYDWPRSFANQDEVQKYIEDVIDKYAIRSHFRFNTPVREVVWNDAANTYAVHTPSGKPEEFNVVVSGVGMLNDPVVPDWPGLDEFQGPKFHTARWQHQHDLAGKRVAVVGTGSTASQVVPAIAPKVGHLFLFQREPGFVLPKGDRVFTQAERDKLRRWPILQKLDRIKSFVNIERFRSAARPLAAAQRMLHTLAVNHLEKQIKNPELRKKLAPNYAFFCKRPILSDDFYPALERSNVEVVPKAVTRVTRTGVVDAAGVEREIDVLVIATGFKPATYLSSLEVKGRGGRSIHEVWGTEPRAFLGLSVPGFPNFFMLYGPNTNGGSIVFQLERQAEWVVSTVKRMARKGAPVCEIKPSLYERFSAWVDKGNRGTTWESGGCNHTYYLSPAGRVVTQWPYSWITYWLLTKLLRPFAYAFSRR